MQSATPMDGKGMETSEVIGSELARARISDLGSRIYFGSRNSDFGFKTMQTLTAACNAMATRFEMVLHGENAVALRGAADQACQEIERLHAQLSLYLPTSEVSYINAHAGRKAVQVEPRLFGLLQLAQRIHQETGGAFDITIAPLVRCWGFMGGSGALPTPEQIAEARAQVGMRHVVLDDKRFTIQFARPGMMIDLGSIGKGYALELAMETLIEAGVQNALVHGGTSTVCAMGRPLGGEVWKVGVDAPPSGENGEEQSGHQGGGRKSKIKSKKSSQAANGLDNCSAEGPEQATHPPDISEPKRPLAVVELKDEALSVSGVHGKCFRAHGKTYGHVIDPRTGAPAEGALLAAVVLPSAAETDAFSTALLLGGLAGHDQVSRLRDNMRTLVVERNSETGQLVMAGKGITPFG
jgi:FAD:protein FMN transferase